MKNIKLYIVLSLALGILLIAWLVDRQLWHGKLNIVDNQDSVFVDNNATLSDVVYLLAKKRVINHPRMFLFIAKRHLKNKNLRYGDYKLKPGLTGAQLFYNMQTGRGQVLYHITFIEGWTYAMMLEKIQSIPYLKCDICNIKPEKVMLLFNNDKKNPEGMFYPDTYSFYLGDDAVSVLSMSYKKMQTILNDEWQRRAKDLPYKSPYEALIAASLIESETSLNKERPLVASVIVNRLRRGMRLQIDPTVTYGLKLPYGTILKRSDLKKCTPHNTYCHHGLPPTPINMPGKVSIVSALNPSKTNYLYYFSKGDGSHKFSTNYKDHLDAIKTYRKSSSSNLQEKSQQNHFSKSIDLNAAWHHFLNLSSLPICGVICP